MKRVIGHWSLVIGVLLGSAFCAFADGGAVLSQQKAGSWLVTVFGSPAPLRAGPADLSVMVQDAATGAPVLAERVSLKVQASASPGSEAWVPPCCSMKKTTGVVEASHAAAQNKLLYAANVILPASGAHDVIVRIGGESPSSELLTVPVNVEPPAPPLSHYWAWLAAPPLLVVVFGLNQRLRRRERRV